MLEGTSSATLQWLVIAFSPHCSANWLFMKRPAGLLSVCLLAVCHYLAAGADRIRVIVTLLILSSSGAARGGREGRQYK